MNIVRWKYREVFPNCIMTYGNETFVKRNELRLEKTHYNDAFVISGGTSQIKTYPIFLGQKHKNNRTIQLNRKGFRPLIRKKRYSIQPYDTIIVKNIKYTVKGCSSYGKYVRCTNGMNILNFSAKNIEKVFHTKTQFIKEE
jgi:hypothetical protein